MPGVHVDTPILELVELLGKDPQRSLDMFTEAAREVIARGAGAIIPAFGAWGSFLGQRNIHDIDGAPIVDMTAVVIKTAEMLVDLQNLGIKRSRRGVYSHASKEELIAARKLYGVE